MIRLERLRIPLNVITTTTEFQLLDIRPVFHYENGSRTDVLEGFKYVVGDPALYEQLEIKILGTQPLLSNEQLRQISQPVLVRFTNCFVRPYRLANGAYALSFSADAVMPVQ